MAVWHLSETDLFFFTAAHMVPCFRFGTEMMLLAHQSFVCRWAELVQNRVSLFPPFCQQVGLGWARNWKETQRGQQTKPTNSNIPCHMMPCSAGKAQGRKKKRGKFGVMAWFPKQSLLVMKARFWGSAKHLSANGE